MDGWMDRWKERRTDGRIPTFWRNMRPPQVKMMAVGSYNIFVPIYNITGTVTSRL
jgi:hypothetical protein